MLSPAVYTSPAKLFVDKFEARHLAVTLNLPRTFSRLVPTSINERTNLSFDEARLSDWRENEFSRQRRSSFRCDPVGGTTGIAAQ